MTRNSFLFGAEKTNRPVLSAGETLRPTADSVFQAVFTSLDKGVRGAGLGAQDGDVAAMSDAAVLARFESLGDNCEFGIVQKWCGFEANGLLASARTPPDALVEILRADLAGVSDPATMRLAARPTGAGSEYVLMNERYGIVYHIVGDAAAGSADDVVRAETDRLCGLEFALREKLARGTHIFVMKSNEDLCQLETDVVLQQLKRYGRNALLYVVQATTAHAEGSVIRVGDGLYRGHIDRFAPYRDAHDTRVSAWTAICRNALALHRAGSRDAA